MELLRLGNSGLLVSRLVFGTLTFGGTHGFGPLGSASGEEARRQIDIALDAGVNAIDTANLYSHGDAETIVGEAMAGRRDAALIFTKAGFPVSDDPNARGAGRSHILAEIEKSLRRLRTDHVDLYFVHIWDGVAPVEETVETMAGLVRAGKIRHWGVSNYNGWQLARTVMTARAMNLPQPVAHQFYYSAEAREAEYELFAAGAELGVSSMIWSALGGGFLTGKVTRESRGPADSRQGAKWREPWIMDEERLHRVVDALRAVATEQGASVSQVALAWVKAQPNVGPIVIGARSEAQLHDNLGADALVLTPEQLALVEGAARPAPLYPYWHRAMYALPRATPAERPYLEGYLRTMRGE